VDYIIDWSFVTKEKFKWLFLVIFYSWSYVLPTIFELKTLSKTI